MGGPTFVQPRHSMRGRSVLVLLLFFSSCTAQPAADTASEAGSAVVAAPTTAAESAETSSPQTTAAASTTTTERRDILALHVSPDGDDSGIGTSDSPLATVGYALSLVGTNGTIFLHAGEYEPFEVHDAADLVIRSQPGEIASIVGEGYDDGRGVSISSSTNITLTEIEVSQVLWGVWIESSSGVHLTNSTISDLGQEGVMVKQNSSDVLIEANTIHGTGRRIGDFRGTPYSHFGEAVYIGHSRPLDDGSYDQSNNVIVRGNTIHDTTAEAVDIKSWADDVLVEGNLIYDVDTATSGAIVVGIGEAPSPATNIVIRDNVIHDITRTSEFNHGTAIAISAPATVTGNIIWNVQHYGILIDRRLNTSVSGAVAISGNVILSSGLDSIAQLSSHPSIAVTIDGNLTGQAAQDILGTTPNAADARAALASLNGP